MNTKGHESVAKTAGIPELEKVFSEIDKRSLQAFYLGNWLTDVSQLVDPVAYQKGSSVVKEKGGAIADKIKESFDTTIDQIIATMYEQVPVEHRSQAEPILKYLKPDIAPYIDKAKDYLHEKIDYFVTMQANERDTHLANFAWSCFFVKGYFKFVHPQFPGEGNRMDFDCFTKVFGSRPSDANGIRGNILFTDRPGSFTQYYPHEHLDRPPILRPPDPKGRDIYAPGLQIPGRPYHISAGSPPAGTRSPRNRKRIHPDLYSYLRDGIEMIAGLLADVDLDFEEASKQGIKENDPKWHKTLAKFGHAMHSVEDFFAHSNWTELAVKSLGSKFISKALEPKLSDQSIAPEWFKELFNHNNTIYERRLLRHITKSNDCAFEHKEDEDWVVTGYFDFNDTAISVAHLAEELWGGHVPNPVSATHETYEKGKEVFVEPKTALSRAKKIMQDTLDFIEEFRDDPKKALKNDKNAIAKKLNEKYESDYKPDLIRLLRQPVSDDQAKRVAELAIRENDFLRQAPPRVQEEFLYVIVEGTRYYQGIKTGISIYRILRDISDFTRNPMAWIVDFLKEYLTDRVVDALKFYGKEKFLYSGADRIGCHSLLAKDHGYEPFYEYQKECAMAIHWYIVKLMLRWWSLPTTTTATITTRTNKYIDWLELLEFFLRNPLPPYEISYRENKETIPNTVMHITTEGEHLCSKDPNHSIASMYGVHWKRIADVNFDTTNLSEEQAWQVIENILHDPAWGVRIGNSDSHDHAQEVRICDSDYAFKSCISIIIPDQKVRKAFVKSSKSTSPTWFEQVFEQGWEIFRSIEDTEAVVTKGVLNQHVPKMISHDDLLKLRTAGRKLRRQARQNYSISS